MQRWIRVLEPHERLGLDDADTELFVKLAGQRVLATLPSIALAARKLPESGHRPTGRPLPEQHVPAGVLNQRSYDIDARAVSHYKRPWQCLYFFPEPHGHG